jgi:hypothetical protein
MRSLPHGGGTSESRLRRREPSPHRVTCLRGPRGLDRLTRAPSRVGEGVRRSLVEAARRLRLGLQHPALFANGVRSVDRDELTRDGALEEAGPLAGLTLDEQLRLQELISKVNRFISEASETLKQPRSPQQGLATVREVNRALAKAAMWSSELAKLGAGRRSRPKSPRRSDGRRSLS